MSCSPVHVAMAAGLAAALAHAGAACSTGGNGSAAPAPPHHPTPQPQSAPVIAAPAASDATAAYACNDGIDNDGDGLVDWGMDLGCHGPNDTTEQARPRAEEAGFTTWDIGPDSRVVYVSTGGDDARDGSSPAQAVATLSRAVSLVRDGAHDFIRLRRGDTFRDGDLGDFKSGRDPAHPMVVATYGTAAARPRIEVDDAFIQVEDSTRSHVALLDLHIVAYHLDPSDPEFDGEHGVGLELVGSGSHWLVEGCHFQYAEVAMQSHGGGRWSDMAFRYNIIERVYHRDTCKPGDPHGNWDYRPSGLFAGHVDGLLIEGNLLDHNGWNTEVPSACATIFNHNAYLLANDLVIRDNLLTRASSIHLKIAPSKDEGRRTTIENNFFCEGELGISASGSAKGPGVFTDVVIRDNVMSDIGRSRPTTRTLAWGIGLTDQRRTLVEDNLVLNHRQPGVDNAFGIMLNRHADTVTIRGNLLYRLQSKALAFEQDAPQHDVVVQANTLVDPALDGQLIVHKGALTGYRYGGNRYFSRAAPSHWFRKDDEPLSLARWRELSGEHDAQPLTPGRFPDPERSVESYAKTLGLSPTLAGFLEAARKQTRQHWDARLTAPALNDYVRAGFGR